MKRLLLTIITALMMNSTALAGPFEDGLAAYNRKDYKTALRILRPLADQGDARAQYNLGFMYGMGQGVPQDYAEVMKWYRKAGDQGLADAQLNLGVSFAKGRGVRQDFVQARTWWKLAAAQGDAEAQRYLGILYETGQGVTQDYVQAHTCGLTSPPHVPKLKSFERLLSGSAIWLQKK